MGNYLGEEFVLDGLVQSSLVESSWMGRKDVQSDLQESESQETPQPEHNPVTAVARAPRLWAVGGGKGGVGKSLICANFSMSLARRGHRVLAVDLDLGGANLHTCVGVTPPSLGIGDWVFGRINDLRALSVETAQPGLKIISGSQDPLRVIAMIAEKQAHLLASLKQLEYDEIVIDLGAGTSEYTLDLFNAADEGILSILPEPTSVENAYRFIRAVFYKRLLRTDVPSGITEVIEAAMDPKNPIGIRTPADLLAIVDRLDPEAGKKLRANIENFSPHIVINQVRSQVDVDVGRAICSVCRRYFGIDVRYPGYIDYDNSVWKAVRAKRAVLQEYPNSPLATKIEHLTSSLLGEEKGLFP